jgi:hypothetical protein
MFASIRYPGLAIRRQPMRIVRWIRDDFLQPENQDIGTFPAFLFYRSAALAPTIKTLTAIQTASAPCRNQSESKKQHIKKQFKKSFPVYRGRRTLGARKCRQFHS